MKKIIACLLLIFVMASCEDFVTGIDEFDPTRPTAVTLGPAYTAMELEFAGVMEGSAARMAGVWSGYFTGTDRQYIDLKNYNVTAGSFDDPWQNMYVFTMAQVRIVQKLAAEQSNKTALGIAQIIEAYVMGNAAVLWEDVPYSEAFDFAKNANPAYDDQLVVLNSSITLLNDAITNLTAAAGTFPLTGGVSAEILNGSTSSSNARLIKWANTLKARYLLYKKDYAGAAAAAALGITSPADDMAIAHGTTNGQNRNVYYDFQVRQRPGYMGGNSFTRNMMGNRANANTNDGPRRTTYFTNGTGGPNTTTGSTFVRGAIPSTGTASGAHFASNASFYLLTSAENLLIRAEAEAMQGIGTPTVIPAAALTALNSHRTNLRGIYTTGQYDNYVASDFDPTHMENASSTYDALTAFIREVWEEKYISLYGQMEVFNEIRRTNNPFGLAPAIGTKLPQRFLYSQNEINANTSTPNPIPDLFVKTALFE